MQKLEASNNKLKEVRKKIKYIKIREEKNEKDEKRCNCTHTHTHTDIS